MKPTGKFIEVTETFNVEVSHTVVVPDYMESGLTSQERVEWLSRLYRETGADQAIITNHKVFIRETDKDATGDVDDV